MSGEVAAGRREEGCAGDDAAAAADDDDDDGDGDFDCCFKGVLSRRYCGAGARALEYDAGRLDGAAADDDGDDDGDEDDMIDDRNGTDPIPEKERGGVGGRECG